MDLWWRLTGYLLVQLTGADVNRTLRMIAAEGIRLEKIDFPSMLTVRFLISFYDYRKLRKIAEKTGDQTKIVSRFGTRETLKKWKNRKAIIVLFLILSLMSVYVPGRILFITVEGNQNIPSRQILEAAAQCGVSFGVSRRMLRSEKVKNQLLEFMPELSWVGVNTRGCVATVTVRERDFAPEEVEQIPGNLVASTDGIVVQMDVTQGNPLCAVGQAVQTGDILVSGYTDLGLCTRAVSPQGEIFAVTNRRTDVILPETTAQRVENGACIKKRSLLLGKNRIKFYQDSGILYPGCGKMTEVNYLTLPGGWQLPVALVTETYWLSQTQPCSRDLTAAASQLVSAARRYVGEQMVAGLIRSQRTELLQQEGWFGLRCDFECSEMIARWSDGAYLEGDAKDD